MATTKYSHAFLVGCFNGTVKHSELLRRGWQQKMLSKDEYDSRLSMYYKSHIDAMTEAEGQQKTDFLKTIHHYQYSYQVITKDKKGYDKIDKMGESVSISLEKGESAITYPFLLCSIDLYFFPFDIILVSIELDDSNSDLDLLTLAHNKLVNWESNINTISDETFRKSLKPLSELLPQEDLSKLVQDGNNLKIFQIVQAENEEPKNELLFEIATFSPIGSVKGRTENSHSEEYFNKLMAENSVSTYFNWKGLALVDSFTVLGGLDFEKKIWQWTNLYYPLVYLRCVFEKTFCFSRNNTYRLDDQQTSVKKLSEDISRMEKYYFYDNFSYNFQPNLVYDVMVKALDIKAERSELSRQVKERAKKEEEEQKEEQEKRFNRILAGVTVFAVISVIWDFCSIVKDAFNIGQEDPDSSYFSWGFIILGAIIIFVLWNKILRKKNEE